jgi:hypothetical protein
VYVPLLNRVLTEAFPPVSVAAPKAEVPRINFTVPVGVPADELTAAVNVTEPLADAGLGEFVSVVLVGNPMTVCTIEPELLA